MKKQLGQFMTTNYEYILQNIKIPENINHIIEPFCGDGDLLKFINKEDYETIECYDIDNKYDYIIKKDTLLDPPIFENKFILTNPPYLARNKSIYKDIYDKYDTNDLYKCFISILINDPPIGGIIIIPLNFFSSIRKKDIELRKKFLEIFNIIQLNIFEENVFNQTSYTICSFLFLLKKTNEENIINVNIYPKNIIFNTLLNDKNNYTIGGNIICNLPINHKFIITRLTKKNKDKANTFILVKCIDDNENNKIGLSYNEKLYIDETENLSCRTYATLIIEPEITKDKQLLLIEKFNTFLNQEREKYNSLFLTNYRESKKNIARKRISFNLVYNIIEYLLENDF